MRDVLNIRAYWGKGALAESKPVRNIWFQIQVMLFVVWVSFYNFEGPRPSL